MKKYKVKSGKLNKTVWGTSRKMAVLKTVKRHRKNLGRFISVVEKEKDELSDASFFLTDTILDMLDFKVVKE